MLEQNQHTKQAYVRKAYSEDKSLLLKKETSIT